MQRAKLLRRTIAAAVLVLASGVPENARAGPVPVATKHCLLQVTGRSASGEFATAPIECYSSQTAARVVSASSSVIARHFTGYNYSGSELDILGADCSGGWVNMPAGWVNVIASTSSICTVDHYDYNYLLGEHVRLTAPGGNLTSFYARTNSAQYL